MNIISFSGILDITTITTTITTTTIITTIVIIITPFLFALYFIIRCILNNANSADEIKFINAPRLLLENRGNRKLICECNNCKDNNYPIYRSSTNCARCNTVIPKPGEQNGIYNLEGDYVFRGGHPPSNVDSYDSNGNFSKSKLLYYFDLCGGCKSIILLTPTINDRWRSYYLELPDLPRIEDSILAPRSILYEKDINHLNRLTIPSTVLKDYVWICLWDYIIMSDKDKSLGNNNRKGKQKRNRLQENKRISISQAIKELIPSRQENISKLVLLMACDFIVHDNYDLATILQPEVVAMITIGAVNSFSSQQDEQIIKQITESITKTAKEKLYKSETVNCTAYSDNTLMFLVDLAKELEKRIDGNRRVVRRVFELVFVLDIENVILDYVDRTSMFWRQCKNLLRVSRLNEKNNM